MSDKFTVEQVEQFESDLREVIWEGKGSIHNNEFRAKFQDRIADMLRAYAARLREDALDTKMLDFLDAHPQLVLRTGKQAMRPLILAAMREHGGAK